MKPWLLLILTNHSTLTKCKWAHPAWHLMQLLIYSFRSYYSKRCNEELAHLVNIAATHGQKLRIFKSKARIQVQKCSSLYSSEGYSTLVETLLEAIQPNFVLCVGNTNDQDKPMTSCEESMFSTLYGHGINRDHLYTVAMTTKKCTMANWELRDSTDMVDLFKQLVEIKKEGV